MRPGSPHRLANLAASCLETEKPGSFSARMHMCAYASVIYTVFGTRTRRELEMN